MHTSFIASKNSSTQAEATMVGRTKWDMIQSKWNNEIRLTMGQNCSIVFIIRFFKQTQDIE